MPPNTQLGQFAAIMAMLAPIASIAAVLFAVLSSFFSLRTTLAVANLKSDLLQEMPRQYATRPELEELQGRVSSHIENHPKGGPFQSWK